MKKNILKILIVFCISCFALSFIVKANAEEVQEDVNQEVTEEETTEGVEIPEETPEEQPETPVEEEPTIEDMFNDFINKWASAIFGALGGASGMAVVIFISKKAIQKLIDKVMNNADASEKEKKEAVEKLEASRKVLENAEKSLTVKVEEVIENAKLASAEAKELVDKVVGSSEETLAKFNKLQNELNQFKQLIGVLISTTPEFASNGIATKILELLNEGVNSNEQKKN